MRTLCFLCLFCCTALAQETAFEAVHILERDAQRVKATGDLRGGAKLMKATVRFRDSDLLIAGNDYRYGYLTLVPYAHLQMLTYSDIGGDLPKSMREDLPLFNPDYAGQDQRWLKVVYTLDNAPTDVFLMLDKDAAELLRTLENRTQKSVGRFIDGLPYGPADPTFRRCRIFQTTVDDKERARTDDFDCLVVMTDSAFVVAGRDNAYQGRTVIPYARVQNLFYEHGQQTSYMGRMPGLSAFRKPKHWFVIEHTDPAGMEGTATLLLEPEIVADFRDAAQNQSGRSIKTYAVTATPTPASILPQRLDLPGPSETVQPALTSARTIRCTFGPGYRAHWADQKLTQEGETRFGDDAPDLIFEQIDWQAQTARMRRGDLVQSVQVVASGDGITFVGIGEHTTLTTVFAQDGRLMCVHSQHTGGPQAAAGQFYGVAVVVE